MTEYCLCGIPKDDHYIAMLDKFVGQSVDEAMDGIYNEKARLQAAMFNMLTVYGNICTNYRQDNLRFLEDKARVHHQD
jgi:hypothetical protein